MVEKVYIPFFLYLQYTGIFGGYDRGVALCMVIFLDPFIEVLVDELLGISGSTMYDAYSGAPFHVKISVLGGKETKGGAGW